MSFFREARLGRKQRILFIFLLVCVLSAGATVYYETSSVYASTAKPKSQFVNKNGKWYYYNSSGKLVKGWYTSKSGTKYYFGKTGAAQAGILAISGKKYCFNSKGKMLTGWQTVNKKTYFFDVKDGHMHTGWTITEAGNRYYFWNDGAICPGWHKVDGKIYYFNEKGKMEKNCFRKKGDHTFYLTNQGTPAKGRLKIGNYWYAFHRETGVLVKNGWYKEADGSYYYASASGKLVSGFYKPDDYYRYFQASDCKLLTGWQDIDGNRYYFKKTNGIRYDNRKVTMPSGEMYYFASNGKLYRKGWFKKDGNYYYANTSGILATGWLILEENTYYLNPKTGIRTSGWVTVDSEKYYLNPSTGILAKNTWVDKENYVGENGALIPGYQNQSFRWPLSSVYKNITSYFGNRESPGGIGSTNHQGIDIYAPTGTPIYAAASGTVVAMQKPSQSNGGGNYTMVNHEKGIITEYMHQSKFAETLKVGDKVVKGEIIGYVGTTGNVTGPHLHFGVIVNGVRRDPLNYVKKP